MRVEFDRNIVPECEPQPVCGFTSEDYAQFVADLLPTGWAWPRDPDTVLMRTFAGLAVEFARVHRRDCDLLSESYPGSALETLSDWERVCGLPDPCIEPPLTGLQERRAVVLAKLATRGGQSRAYYIAVAKALGFDITITEFFAFRAGRNRAICAISVEPMHPVPPVTRTVAPPSQPASSASGTAMPRRPRARNLVYSSPASGLAAISVCVRLRSSPSTLSSSRCCPGGAASRIAEMISEGVANAVPCPLRWASFVHSCP